MQKINKKYTYSSHEDHTKEAFHANNLMEHKINVSLSPDDSNVCNLIYASTHVQYIQQQHFIGKRIGQPLVWPSVCSLR